MRIIIGGGAGYIGTLLSEKLFNLGYDVTVVDLFWFGNKLNKNIKYINKDLIDFDVDDFLGYDQFIFLAGLSNDPMADYNPKLNYLSNGTIPSLLAVNAKKAGIKRFIYASSCSVYGNTDNNFVDEDGKIGCNFTYGISKYQGEIGISNLTDETFSTICLRMGTLGGYSKRMRYDLVLNAMFKSAINNNQININNPNILRPLLDIRDACQVYIKSIECDYSISGVFNVCSENTNLGNLGQRIKSQIEKLTDKNIKLNILNIQDNRNYCVNINKAERILKYKPMYKIEDTVLNIYNSLDKGHLISDSNNINIEVFKKMFNTEIMKSNDYKLINNCRVCYDKLTEILDLNDQPLANNFHNGSILLEKFPLKLMLCSSCFHSQLSIVVKPEILFKNYLYVSGTSKTLTKYFEWFVDEFIPKYMKNPTNVLEIACNDCSLLDIFHNKGWDTYGVDPAENIFKLTKNKPHTLICNYWNYNTSKKIKQIKNNFDLIVAQNVFAHLDDIHNFLKGCKNIMNNNSLLFIQTSQKNMFYNYEFDTIYHEHLSFFSIKSMKTVVENNGLFLNDIIFPDIHGKSYLFLISLIKKNEDLINEKLNDEYKKNRYNSKLYREYSLQCSETRNLVYEKIQEYKKFNKKFIGYGAAAKATVFLNFCNIDLEYVVDENKEKHNLYIPGTKICIKSFDYFSKEKEDVVCIIFAWNFSSEISKKIKTLRPNNNDEIIKFYPSFEKL